MHKKYCIEVCTNEWESKWNLIVYLNECHIGKKYSDRKVRGKVGMFELANLYTKNSL